MSLDLKNTAYSVLICFIQTSAWYIGNHENDIAKGFSRTTLQVLLQSFHKILQNPEDFGQFSLDEMCEMISECYQ